VHKVILLHGVNNRAGVANWPNKLEAMWEQADVPFRVSTWSYGGLMLNRTSAALTWLPWYRRWIADTVLKALKEIQQYGAGFSQEQGKLSIIGHSFAGQIVQRALESGWHFHRIILLASAMDEDFVFNLYDNQFDEIYAYWSPSDEVIPWSYYGRQGVIGPLIKHGRVFSCRETGYKHSDWVTDAELKNREVLWRAQLGH
jgi:hypothetical protein